MSFRIITEGGNSELSDKSFVIPKGVKAHLQKTLDNYKGDKTIDGYKRLNNLLSMDRIKYNELKRLKNFFDTYVGSHKSSTFILNGGESMCSWVNTILLNATYSIWKHKMIKKSTGMKNAFIRSHSKNIK